MTDTKTLILQGSGYELLVAPEAEALKADLLKRADLISQVSVPDEYETARVFIKQLAAMRNAVEKSRNAVKAPVLQVGRDIDAKAKDFVAEIDAEEKRLNRLMGDYAEKVEMERLRVMREMEAKRQAEEKAAREAEAAKLKAEQEAEAARIAAEKALWESSDEASEAKAAEARAQAEAAAEAARKQAEAEAARAAETVKMVAFVPAKVEGVKFTVDFEVEDIDALYRYSPALVTMEAKRKDILELIKQLGADENSQIIPGIRITKKTVVSTR